MTSGPSDEGYRGIARILMRENGSWIPIGGGVLVPGNQVITAAHVVNTALGRLVDAAKRPKIDAFITLDFPFMAGKTRFEGSVVKWVRPADGDNTTLQVVGEVNDAVPATLATEPVPVGTEVQVHGFTDADPEGTLARMTLAGRVANGCLLLHGETTLESTPILQGFSGGPVIAQIDKRPIVVGIVARAPHKRNVAMIIPASKLIRKIVADEPVRGSVGHKITRLRTRELTALFHDLEERRFTGVPDPTCDDITTTFGKLSNILSDLEFRAIWKTPPFQRMSRIRTIHAGDDGWNTFPKERDYADQRSNRLAEMRAQRAKLSENLQQAYGSLMNLNDIDEVFGDMLTELRTLSEAHPSVLSNLYRVTHAA